MAKAKLKAAAVKAKTAVLAAQMKAKPTKLNPFELKGSKGHFDTIGRRVSGKKQNVIQARQEAVNRRKGTLLVEYRQLRKANTFVDRRFGETDPELTESDKGLARLQAQRIKEERSKKKKRGSKYTLSEGEGEGEGLTHRGRSLADDIRDFMDQPEFDDLDEEMVEDLVAQYHFGGGVGSQDGEEGDRASGGESEGAAAHGPDGKPKTRKQIMEEIIAKSRMYRALKAKQREEDEAALEAVDEEFKELVRTAALARLIKAPGESKGVKGKADNPEDAAYDVAARELAFESKGVAGDRTLSPEELLEKERQRLEKLERERVKRMQGEDVEEEEEEEEGGGDEEEGRRKRRRELPSGDALGDDYESEDGGEVDETEDGIEAEEEDADGMVSELDKRRMKAAAGSHPLQENFRAAAAALAKKHGVEAPKNPYLNEDEEEGESEEEEGESEEEGGSEEGGEQEESASDGDGDEDSDQEQLEQRRNPAHPPSTSRPGDDRVGDAKAKVRGAKNVATTTTPINTAARTPEGPLDLPYTIPLPTSYNEFAALVKGRPAEDLHTAITRIRAFNAVALATDKKRKMQEFYGILVQHFVMEATKSPLPVPSLDVLTRVLLELTPEVPYYAATVARARLGRMADQLTAALGGRGATRETAAATASSPWPPARVVLQLKLFVMLFPTSDRRHPVLTPAALLIGKYLNQCVVGNPHEAAVGLCLCGLMTHMASPARRTTPEVLVFLRDCLAAFLPVGSTEARPGAAAQKKAATASGAKGSGANGNAEFSQPLHPPPQQLQWQGDSDAFVRFAPGLLALDANVQAAVGSLPPLELYGVLGMSASDPRVGSEAFKLGLFRVALCGVRRSATLASKAGLVCFEQLFAPLRSVVSELQRLDRLLPEDLRGLSASVLEQLSAATASCVDLRRPMVHPASARAAAAGAVREFNPRFEDGFVAGRDYDPDRQRSETRRLKRALVKERRGAIRELRRDAVFMAEERDRETGRVDAERLENERRFYAELQRQEADLRSGGQGGMNPHLRKKRGGAGKR